MTAIEFVACATDYASHRAAPGTGEPPCRGSDPVTAEVIRNALISISDQMQIAIQRTALSPVIYDLNDCCCAIYDRNLRLLAQASDGLPCFAGVLGAAVQACLDNCGGPEALEPGDLLLTTHSYHQGSHLNDAALVTPAFFEGQLVGYACSKCHMLDVGQKDPVVSLDSVDLFQEGLIVPGVKLYRAGVRNDDLYRTILANSRLPGLIAGDLGSMIGAIKIGAQSLERLVGRYGIERFRSSVELVFGHSEAVMRSLISSIPDGRYVGTGVFEGRPAEEPTAIELAVEVTGSTMVVDLTAAPDQLPFPENLPVPNVVSAVRGWLLSLIGSAETINEGYFAPLEIRTRPGSMFHPLPPAPVSSYIFGLSGLEGFLRALSGVLADRIPAQLGGDTEDVAFFGLSDEGSFWATVVVMFGGQGALPDRDGTCPLPFIPWSGMRMNSCEIMEARTPVLVEGCELRPDSAGIGKFRGYPGFTMRYRVLRPMSATMFLDRTKAGAYGLHGGGCGVVNAGRIIRGDQVQEHTKSMMVPVTQGDVIELRLGGGGGYGHPAERDPAAVHADIREGYVTEESARRDYPHAFPASR
jgi:N-methylhydantoinase B